TTDLTFIEGVGDGQMTMDEQGRRTLDNTLEGFRERHPAPMLSREAPPTSTMDTSQSRREVMRREQQGQRERTEPRRENELTEPRREDEAPPSAQPPIVDQTQTEQEPPDDDDEEEPEPPESDDDEPPVEAPDPPEGDRD
ncbi:MAG TPA: hypothetical protein VM534_04365, partial [Thermoanaerobaculia bacterium]|nr:hypothetical protein [Thermoanaerobaculia bacterium]